MMSWLLRAENTKGRMGTTGGSTLSFCFSSFIWSGENWICYGWAHLTSFESGTEDTEEYLVYPPYHTRICSHTYSWIINIQTFQNSYFLSSFYYFPKGSWRYKAAQSNIQWSFFCILKKVGVLLCVYSVTAAPVPLQKQFSGLLHGAHTMLDWLQGMI